MYLLSWGSDVSQFLLTPCSSGLQTFGLPLFAWPLVVYFVSVLLMVVQSRENSRKLVERPGEGGWEWGRIWEQRKRIIEIFLAVLLTFAFFILLFWFPFCLSLFCFLFSPETPFHFTLPKEGDVIPPLTGATPPLIGHLKLEPKRHSTPIGEWLKCNDV